jgi:hypothetical protein
MQRVSCRGPSSLHFCTDLDRGNGETPLHFHGMLLALSGVATGNVAGPDLVVSLSRG